jgi:hypothetical protein
VGNLALGAACALMLVLWPLFRGPGYRQLCFVMVNAGFIFWYWLPAMWTLNAPLTDGTAEGLTQDALDVSAWIVLAYHAAALLVLIASRKALTPMNKTYPADSIALKLPSAVVLISSIALLVVRFSNEGPNVIFSLLVGLTSAREYMTFFNRSESAADSLLALWEIANVWAALFLLASHVLRARLLSASGVMASLALVICFLGSGTRSLVLMGIFVVMAGRLTRNRPAVAAMTQPLLGKAASYWYGVLVLAIVAAVGLGLSVRFDSESGGSDSNFLMDAVLSNNDMFRELAFAEAQLADYAPTNVTDFALTPFTFSLPGFLGFEKTIPDHLLYFNYHRAGIDLLHAQGNVFPGVIADFHMVFGASGPVWFALFLAAFLYAAKLASTFLPCSSVRLAFQITFLSYLLVSFRNIHGGLLLILVLGVVLAKLTARLAPHRPLGNARLP